MELKKNIISLKFILILLFIMFIFMFVKGTHSDSSNSYNIKFDLNGGVEREDYDYSDRKLGLDESILVGDPKKPGYKFLGWKLENFDVDNAYISSTEIGKYVKDGYYDVLSNKWVKYINSEYLSVWLKKLGKVNETVKLIAQWEKSEYSYNIEFDLNGGYERDGYDYDVTKLYEGESLEFGDPKKYGYKFIGWKLENFDVDNAYIAAGTAKYVKDGYYDIVSNKWLKYVNGIYTTILLKDLGKANETVKLVAQWEEAYSYNIEFDLNGGVEREDYDYSLRKIYEDEFINVGDPKKDGYKFIGWKLENFDINNAFVDEEYDKYVKDGYYDVTSNKWTKYINNDIYVNIWLKDIGKTNETVKMIAQWEEAYSYNIEFDLNGGVEREDYDYSSRKLYEDEFINAGDPIKKGYKFIGWKLEKFDIDNAYADNKYVKIGYYDVSNDMWIKYINDPIYFNIYLKDIGKANETVKLVAQWEEAYSYNIEFDLNGGVEREDYDYSSRKLYEDESILVGDPIRKGYKFIGWKLENFDVDSAFIMGTIDKHVKDGYYDVTSNKWTKYINDIYVNIWLKDIGKTNETVKMIAQWEEAYSYNIEFDLNGGNASEYFEVVPEFGNITKNVYEGESSLKVYEEEILAIFDPVKKGYKFIGWKLENFDIDNAYFGEYVKDGYYDVSSNKWLKYIDTDAHGLSLKNIGKLNDTVKLVAQWEKSEYSYNIEYDLNGGIERDTVSYEYEDYTSIVKYEGESFLVFDPIKDGYKFIGWKLENFDVDNAYFDSSDKYVKDIYYDVLTGKWKKYIDEEKYIDVYLKNIGKKNETVKLVAQWEKSEYSYNIEFDLNGGVGRKNYDYSTRKIDEGSDIEIGNPTRNGYTFIGWKLENFDTENAYVYSSNKYVKDIYYDVSTGKWKKYIDSLNYDYNFLWDIGKANETVKLVAQWKENDNYNIEFDFNSGVGREDYDYSSRKIYMDESINIGDPTRKGYKFIGWKLENFDEDKSYISLEGIMKYVKDGYYDISSKTWIKYIDSSEFTNVWLMNIGKANETVKLVAQWKENDNYNIEFVFNGGIGREDCSYGNVSDVKCDYSTRKIYINESINIGDPTRKGYKFIGWKLENFDEENAYISLEGIMKYVKDGYYDISSKTWIKYIDSSEFTNVWLMNIGKANETVKIVAQWKENDSYNIEFDLNGGVGREDYDYSSRKIYMDESINIGDPTRKGYKFIGWKLENFDEDKSYISLEGIMKYVKDGYYDISSKTWIKYIDSSDFINIWLMNIGKFNETVKIVAQWEKLNDGLTNEDDNSGNSGIPDDDIGSGGPIEDEEKPGNSGTPDIEDNPGNVGIPDDGDGSGNIVIPDLDDNFGNIDENPQTGGIGIFVTIIIGIVMLGVSIYYFRNKGIY